MSKHFKMLIGLLMATLLQGQAAAAQLDHKQVCTWDPVGKNGPVISFFMDLVPKAQSWGLDIHFLPYLDENLAAQDFIDGKCDMVIVTAILSRDFVKFAGTLDAIGGITSEKKLRQTIASIASPKATVLMSEDDYEAVAALPVGSMFAFVKDRRVRSIDDFRNKRIAVLNGDIQTKMFAELSGALPVEETLATFSHSFRANNVDIVLMPALAYDAFELNKGLGTRGGILDIRMFYGMLQAVSRKSSFEDDFGQNMRRYMLSKLDAILTMIDQAEASIPDYYWIRTSQKAKDELAEFYKDIRLNLKIDQKFDTKALSLLWKIRCNGAVDKDECT